jgi:aryl-alcohol dehydrogenase-like predicted oxidoreductase
MWAAAQAVGGPDHHFRVLQLPMNLIESEAALMLNEDGATVLGLAQSLGMGVLVNRPLNAIVENRLVRLAGATGEPVVRLVDASLPVERRAGTVSQRSLYVVASTSGVTSALVGMRRPPYVDDAMEILRWPRLGPGRAEHALAAIREQTAE